MCSVHKCFCKEESRVTAFCAKRIRSDLPTPPSFFYIIDSHDLQVIVRAHLIQKVRITNDEEDWLIMQCSEAFSLILASVCFKHPCLAVLTD